MANNTVSDVSAAVSAALALPSIEGKDLSKTLEDFGYRTARHMDDFVQSLQQSGAHNIPPDFREKLGGHTTIGEIIEWLPA